ncbi:MAG: DUF3592 domain-containing protein [Bacteroidota bacterium]
MYSSTSKPPRKLSLFSQLVLLNSGFGQTFGWLFFGFGMIFFWVFFMGSEAVNLINFADWSPTNGIVTRVSDTNASENEESVVRVQYRYAVDGDSLEQTGYVTGYWPAEGTVIAVEYDAQNPHVARAEGMRRKMFGWGGGFVIIFPLVGLAFIVFTFKKNFHDIRLLIHGHFTRGKMIDKRSTNTQVNNQTVYAYTFEFEAKNGRTYTVESRTAHTELLEDEETEQIIYLANHPEKATLFDTISGGPTLKSDGTLAEVSYGRAVVLIPPAITLIGHGLYAAYRYGIL